MMYYSSVIWNLYYLEKKSVREIVEQFDLPLLNEKFVTTVIENNCKLRLPPSYIVRKHGNKTRMSKIYKKIGTMISDKQKAGMRYRPRKHPKKLWS